MLNELRAALENAHFQAGDTGRRGPGALHLWLLEKIIGTSLSVEPLYAVVIPSGFEGGGRLSTARLKESNVRTGPDGDERLRFRKLIVHDTLERLDALILELAAGATLADAARRLGYEPPPPNVARLVLGTDMADIAGRFVVRPFIFLEGAQVLGRLQTYAQPYASPYAGPSFCLSLTRLDKLQAFAHQGRPLVDADDLLIEALRLLEDETGLSFLGTDGKRFGNLEWIMPAGEDVHENPLVKLRKAEVEGTRGIRVEILPGALPVGSRLLVRCRARCAHAVVFDWCLEHELTSEPLAVGFPVGTDADSTLISVWVRSAPDAAWELWYEDDGTFLRGVTLDMGMIGLQGTIESASLDRLKGKGWETKARALASFTQTHRTLSRVGGKRDQDYFEAENGFESKIEALRPPASGGAFFRKWGEPGEPGILTFMQWFLDTLDDHRMKAVVLMDPYFDDAGIELFAKSRIQNVAYRVLTVAQLKSKDEAEPDQVAEATEPKRARKIQAACAQFAAIFSRLDFEVLDLRSPGGGDKQHFHDRYLLLEGRDGFPDKGFHLSNSIQGATRSHPLLATPIPPDILPQVKAYMKKMMAADREVTQADVQVLYASRAERELPGEVDEPRPSLNPGFPLTEADASEVSAEEAARRILAYLEAAPMPLEFAHRWQLVGTWLASCGSHVNVLTQMVAAGGGRHTDNLRQLIRSATFMRPPFGFARSKTEIVTLGLAASIQKTFKESLPTAEGLFSHPLIFVQPANFPLHFAMDLLVMTDVRAFVGTFDDIVDAYCGLEGGTLLKYETGFQNTLRLMIEALVDHLYNPRRAALEALFGSRTSILRGIGAVSARPPLDAPVDPAELDKCLRLLTILPADELRSFLVAWVGNLRIGANRRHGATAEEDELRRKLFSRIAGTFQEAPSVDELQALAIAASGPLAGAWAVSTDAEMMEGFISGHVADVPLVAGAWLGILIARFEALATAAPQKRARAGFSWDSCAELTDVTAFRFSQLAAADQGIYLKRLDQVLRASLRTVRQPFKRKSGYTTWRDRFVLTSWIEVFLRMAIYHARRRGAAPDEVELLLEIATEAREAIAPFPIEEEGRAYMPEVALKRLRERVDELMKAIDPV